MDKTPELDAKRVMAAAHRALMAADSQYYSWSSEKQERFRATLCGDALIRVRRVLLESLLGIQCSPDRIYQVWDDLPLNQVTLLNWASLLTTGIGEDNIYLNEHLSDGQSLLDFETLYDYDHDHYMFQEEVKGKEIAAYERADYYALRHPFWVRLTINGHFHYATLLSLATYFADAIESAGNDLIDQLSPHEYVEGEDNGKAESGGVRYDMKLDAAGLEGQLDELRSRWYRYQSERWIDLSKRFSQLPPAVYIADENKDDGPDRSFIFNNAAILRKVRWRHFLSDCRPYVAELSSFDGQLAQEIERATAWLKANHHEIMNNFDPTVVKLRRKRRIVFLPDALEDLNKIARQDESLD